MQWQLLLLFRDFKQRQAVVVKQSRWWWCVLGEFGKGVVKECFVRDSREGARWAVSIQVQASRIVGEP